MLVKRLVDIAEEKPSLDALLEQLSPSSTDFFSVFVRSLILREANEKWIDRSGAKEVGASLLTIDEHCELLSLIALSMWESKVDFIKQDNLEFVADYFSETTNIKPTQARQIRERISCHAMLIPSTNAVQAVEFDHDDFRNFFLGEGIAQYLSQDDGRAIAEILGVLRRGILPQQAQHALIRRVERKAILSKLNVVKIFLKVAELDIQASYTHENCSDIIVRLLSQLQCDELTINKLAFGSNALRSRKLSNITFCDCHFSQTSLETTTLDNCTFQNCNLSQLSIFSSTNITNTTFDHCTVEALVFPETDQKVWGPTEINHQLSELGIKNIGDYQLDLTSQDVVETDVELRDMEKIVRYFMRSTHISESVIKIKLGIRSAEFIDQVLPNLLHHEVLKEIENRGCTNQRRFRLNTSLQLLSEAIAFAKGSFSEFLKQFKIPE